MSKLSLSSKNMYCLTLNGDENPVDYVEQHVDDSLFLADCNYVDISNSAKKYTLPKAIDAFKTGGKLFKFCFILNKARSKMALIMAGNHVMVDGATMDSVTNKFEKNLAFFLKNSKSLLHRLFMYTLYKMLDPNQPLITLDRNGVDDFLQKIAEYTSLVNQLPQKKATEKAYRGDFNLKFKIFKIFKLQKLFSRSCI